MRTICFAFPRAALALASLAAILSAGGGVVAQPVGAWRFPLAWTALTPHVSFGGRPADLSRPDQHGDAVDWSISRDGRVLAILRATAVSEAKLDVTLRASVAGTFAYGVSIATPEATPLDTTREPATDGLVSHYPYNWERTGTIGPRRKRDGQDAADVAPIDLVVPGFASAHHVYAVDTWKLTRLTFARTGGRTEVAIEKTVEVNDGFDSVSSSFVFQAGQSTSLTLLAAPDLAAMSRLRFGSPRVVTGRLTFLYNKGWTCSRPECGITPESYEAFAARLDGLFDLAIVRSFDPKPEIASAFVRHKVSPFFYMFLGADRRSDDRYAHEEWVLHDSTGAQYGAPVAMPGAAWGLLDIRRDEVRAALIARAVSAIGMGYRGIFFDGPAFWLARDGHVGGAAKGATMSWTFARALLLQETRAAIAARDPAARIGILGDRYYDAQGLADFCLKEAFSENWLSIDPNPDARALRNASTINAGWDEGTRPYIQNNLFLGQKGANPLLVGAGWMWGRAPAGTWFTEIGDAYRLEGGFGLPLERMGRILADVSRHARTPNDASVRAVEPPGAAILTTGPSVIGAPYATVLTLDRPAPVLRPASQDVAVTPSVHLDADKPAIVAERHDGDWWWTGYGFAYRDTRTWIAGDALLDSAPQGPSRGRLVLHLSTSPGPLSAKTLALPAVPFASHALSFHMTRPKSVILASADGTRTDLPIAAIGSDAFGVTLPVSPAFADYTLTLDFSDTTAAAPDTR